MHFRSSLQFGLIEPVSKHLTRHLNPAAQAQLVERAAEQKRAELHQEMGEPMVVGTLGILPSFIRIVDNLCEGRDTVDFKRVREQALQQIRTTKTDPEEDAAETQYYVIADEGEHGSNDWSYIEFLKDREDPENPGITQLDIYLHIKAREMANKLAEKYAAVLGAAKGHTKRVN